MDLVPKPVYAPFAVGAQVDASRVIKAIELAMFTVKKKTLPKLLWSVANDTAYDAQKRTKALEQGWIDNAMEVDVISYTNATRTRISKNKRGTKFTKTPANPFLPAKAVPLGVLIIMARHRQGSKWNEATDYRWNLIGQALPTGKGTAAARQAQIAAELTRMIRGRHSSTHFLQHGWSAVTKALKRIKPDGAIGFGEKALAESDPTSWARRPLGSAESSGYDSLQWIRISNDVGFDETAAFSPHLDERRRRYLFAVAGPALEEALIVRVQKLRSIHFPRASEEIAAAWNAL